MSDRKAVTDLSVREGRSLTVSVVVPTRGRPEHVRACVDAILANQAVDELLVVDQSDDEASRDELASVIDERLLYMPTDTRGVTRARNLGVERSRGDIVVCTDDDCRVHVDWARNLRAIFETDPDVGVVCGRVIVPKAFQALGHAATFEPMERRWLGFRARENRAGRTGSQRAGTLPRGGYGPGLDGWGITANMAIRRTVHEQVGLFDPFLGAGGPLRSGGEPDFMLRVLQAGLTVVNADEVLVEHLGVRKPRPDWAVLSRRYAYGTGAAYMKHVRMLELAGVRMFIRHATAALRIVLRSTLRSGRPTQARWLASYFAGAIASFRYRIDREKVLFEGRGTLRLPWRR